MSGHLCSFCSVSCTVGSSCPLSVTGISCLAKQISAQGEKMSYIIYDFIYLVWFALVFYPHLCQLQFFIRHCVKKKWPYRQERCDKSRLSPPACLDSCIYTGEEERTSSLIVGCSLRGVFMRSFLAKRQATWGNDIACFRCWWFLDVGS